MIHLRYLNSLCLQHQFFQLIFTWGALFTKTECELKYFIFLTRMESFTIYHTKKLSDNLLTKFPESWGFQGDHFFVCVFSYILVKKSVC